MNSLKKGEGVPLLNFEGGPGILLLNFEGGPGVPLLNFRGVPRPTFKLSGGSRVPGSSVPRSLVPPLHHVDCNTTYAQKSLSHYKALAIMRD